MKKLFSIVSVIMFLQILHLTTFGQSASVTCPGNKVISTNPGGCMGTVTNADPIVSPTGAQVYHEITGPAFQTIGIGTVSGLSLPIGVITIRYYLPDYTGIECEFTVTVEDKVPPVITCPPNVTLNCRDEIPMAEPYTAIDPCSPSGYVNVEFVSDRLSNETCMNRFTLTRTYRATDAVGNTSTCAQIITVNDDVAPVFDQSRPMSPINVACPFQVPNPDEFTAHDECNDDYAGVVFKEVKSDSIGPNKYKLTRTWIATDACGNTALYTQIINVKDTVPPQLNNAPHGLNLVSCASQIPDPPYVTAEDNCYDLGALPTVTLQEVITDQVCANNFKLTRTWTATDASGNISTSQQIFVVLDVSRPVFEGNPPGIVSVSCEKDIPTPPTQTATDNCGAGDVTINYSEMKTNVQCVNRYTLIRTWVATDACGNTASRTQTVNVDDNEGPTVSEVTATPVALWPPNHKMKDVTINYTATDNCNVTSTLSVSSSDPINGGSDGDQSPDWEIIDGHHVRLRAEKANNGQARYYDIKVSITDGCNTPFDTTITVVVAHNITSPQTGHPFKVGSTVPFAGTFWDKPGNKHSAKWLLDGSVATNGNVTEPVGIQNGKVTGSYKFNSPGVYKLQMNVTDQKGATSYVNTNNDLDAIVVIYDPNGGNTYGGGYFESPAGALKSAPSANGKASYGFAMNYFKNSTNPKGETQFEFKVGEFEFNALNFDYLVINNAMAQFKGTGKIIGGQSGIGFTMTVTDGEVDGTGIDKIRMKIYNKNTGAIIYDNQPGASDAELPVQAVGPNSTIVISTNNSSPASVNTGQKAAMEIGDSENSNEFKVNAFPNPSKNNFLINVKSGGSEKITMQVTDLNGKLIETRIVGPHSTIRFGDRYRPGAYLVRILQGKENKEIKLIKISD